MILWKKKTCSFASNLNPAPKRENRLYFHSNSSLIYFYTNIGIKVAAPMAAESVIAMK